MLNPDAPLSARSRHASAIFMLPPYMRSASDARSFEHPSFSARTFRGRAGGDGDTFARLAGGSGV